MASSFKGYLEKNKIKNVHVGEQPGDNKLKKQKA